MTSLIRQQDEDRGNRAKEVCVQLSMKQTVSYVVSVIGSLCHLSCSSLSISSSQLITVSVYYFQEKDEAFGEDKITARDKIMAGCLKCVDFLCVWDCCWCWVRIQEIFALIVFDPFMELFITLCIVVNTLFMAMDHHDMDQDFEKVLKAGNYVSVTNG